MFIIFVNLNFKLIVCHVLEHWRITWRDKGALKKLALSLVGFCLHSNTDNVAFDCTILSQLEWAKVLKSFPSTHYISVVGKLEPVGKMISTGGGGSSAGGLRSFNFAKIYGVITTLLRNEAPPRVSAVNTREWMRAGTDGLLSVYTQEYPRLFIDLPYLRTPSGAIVPEHRGWPLPQQCANLDAAAVPITSTAPSVIDIVLQRGVWYYHYMNISHLATSLGCRETWVFLMHAVRLLQRQQHKFEADTKFRSSYVYRPDNNADGVVAATAAANAQTKSKPSVKSSSSTSVAPKPTTTSPAPRGPDMQTPHLHVPCAHTSSGMSYRWKNVVLAVFLLCIHAYYTKPAEEVLIARSSSFMTLETVVTFSTLWNFLMTAAIVFLIFSNSFFSGNLESDFAIPKYFNNATFLLSDAVEVILAVYRLVDFHQLSGAVSVLFQPCTAASFLCEVIVLSLLPRPMYDYSNSPLAITLAVLLIIDPAIWEDIVVKELLLYYIAAFTFIPKVTWIVIYVEEAVHRYIFESKNSSTSGYAQCRASAVFIWLALLVFGVIWVGYGRQIVLVLSNTSQVDHMSYIDLLTILLLSFVPPMSRILDLSDCIQYVLIKSQVKERK